MIQVEWNVGENFGALGVLQVSTDVVPDIPAAAAHSVEDDGDSLLLQFVAGSMHEKRMDQLNGNTLVNFMVQGRAPGDIGKLPVSPASETMGATSGEWWHSGGGIMFLDAFGDDNLPSFGMQVVEIIGQRLDSHWDFGQLHVSAEELFALDDGGATAGNSDYGGDAGDEPDGQKVDWGKIAKFEGNATKGYVPRDNHGEPFAKSGVTIASGFDLGARNVGDLVALKLPQHLIDKLTPYLGAKGDAAYELIERAPLTITRAEGREINSASHAATLASLVVQYDSAVGIAGAFYDLPGEAQTVIASVSFQYGNLAIKAPNFWNQVVELNWSAAEANLRHFGDDFATRRNSEADMLKTARDAGRLNDGELN